ncbi:hypothetical protein NL676_010409 [Syzygium grande]|nr:hypothetical protein NL676_010409 [Syzygium grande]
MPADTSRLPHEIEQVRREKPRLRRDNSPMAEKTSKVLVIGGTGYIGKPIVEASAKSGHPTFALVRESALSNPAMADIIQGFKRLGINVVRGDICDQESLLNAIRQVDVVISAVGTEQLDDQGKIVAAIEAAGMSRDSCLRTGATAPPRDKVVILGDGNAKAVLNKEDDIGTYTIKAVDDPRTLNKILYVRPPANTYSFNDLVSLWERKIGKALERVYVPEEQVLKNIQAAAVPLNAMLAIFHSYFVKGDQTNFEIEPSFRVEASELYPDVKYTTEEANIQPLIASSLTARHHSRRVRTRGEKSLDDRTVIVEAFFYFKKFRCLLVDLIFSFHESDDSMRFFSGRTAKDAFRVLEAELNFFHDLLYTKSAIVHRLSGFFDEKLFDENNTTNITNQFACQSLLSVPTLRKPAMVKGDEQICVLTKFGEAKWVIVSEVWVALLAYAAIHCRPYMHAQQLSPGGQLVTLVWLLMVHLGLSEQFQIEGGTTLEDDSDKKNHFDEKTITPFPDNAPSRRQEPRFLALSRQLTAPFAGKNRRLRRDSSPMAEKTSKVLVIGGTGYIGKFIVEASAKSGHPTFALGRESHSLQPRQGRNHRRFQELRRECSPGEQLFPCDRVRFPTFGAASMRNRSVTRPMSSAVESEPMLVSILRKIESMESRYDWAFLFLSSGGIRNILPLVFTLADELSQLRGDMYDPESLLNVIKQVDVVISAVGYHAQLEDQHKIVAAIKAAGNIKRFLPSEFGNDVDRVHAAEPAKTGFAIKAKIRQLVEAEGIPYTYVSSNSFAGYYLLTLDNVVILGDGNAKAVFNQEDDIGTYTIKAMDDPRTLNKTLYIRPPANTYSMDDLVSLWERKIGKTLERVYVPEEQVLKNIQDAVFPLNVILAICHSNFVKGDHTNFEIGPWFRVEASELYPDVKYTTVDQYLDRIV